MATILTKKSDTSSSVPLAADLTNAAGGAELAVNTADKRLYSKTSGGSVVELGTNPSALSLPNGTANGVPYLNGSKVLTSGSALTFDGSRFVLGSGVGLAVQGMAFPTSGAGLEAVYDGAEVVLQAYNRTTPGYLPIWLESSYTRFGINGSEAMRLTSTGLGIGTSSPAYKLDVSATGTTVSSAFRSDQSQMWIMLKDSGTALGNVRLGSEAGSFIAYANGNQLTLNSSGNLGLGVTPSAWANGGNIQLGGANIFANIGITYGANAYYNSGFKYITTGYGASYQNQVNGQHQFFTSTGTGTAGNAISFNQSMTLDASGNLLVGTTSAGGYSGLIMGSGKTVVSPGVYASITGAAANVYVAADGSLNRSVSSLKYKQNVKDAVHGLADIAKLRAVTYESKNQNGKRIVYGGLIAEEVHAAGLTEFVQYADDGTPDALAYSNMVSLCIKAIQEQQAIIDQLKARLDAANI